MYLCLIICVWCTCALCNIPFCKSNASSLLLLRFLCFCEFFIILIFLLLWLLCFCSSFEKKLVLRFFYFQGSFVVVKVLLVSWFFSYFKAFWLLWFCNVHCALVYYAVYFCGFTMLLCNFYLNRIVHLLWTLVCMDFLFKHSSL